MRRNPSTVVVLAGRPSEQVLAVLGRSLNVVLVRPEEQPAGAEGGIEAAAAALRRAGGVSAAYVLVAADPLAGVAASWEAMWSLTAETHGSDEFELRAAEALGAWRAKRFELPDYYLVLAEASAPGRAGATEGGGAPGASGTSGAAGAASGAGEPRPDFYLGPLRAVRPNRVAVAAGASPAAQADALLSELGSLRHGPWWPSLEDIVATARGFYPGALAESAAAGQATLLALSRGPPGDIPICGGTKGANRARFCPKRGTSRAGSGRWRRRARHDGRGSSGQGGGDTQPFGG